MGQFLVRNAKISQEQYEESKRRVTPQLGTGRSVVQTGAILPKDVRWGVKNQTLEIITAPCVEEGQFVFYDEAEALAHERIVLHTSTPPP